MVEKLVDAITIDKMEMDAKPLLLLYDNDKDVMVRFC